jgi:serine/threonine protein kinase
MREWIVELLSDPEPSESLTVDSFSRLKLIHRGLGTDLHLVRKTWTGELYALKSVFKNMFADASKALTERNALMKANCPFVVTLHATFQSDQAFHLLLDFVECGTLRDALASSIPLHQRKLYLFEIAIALADLHAIGIVYRNLATDHILIGRDGHVKLVDFSLAYDSSGEAPAIVSAPLTPYSAPEQVMRHRQSFAVDWWAFGVVAFEVFLGRKPFEGALTQDMIASTARAVTNIQIASFLSGLLQRDPEKRLGSAAEEEILAHPVFAGLKREKALAKKYVPEFVPEEVVLEEPVVREKQGEGLVMPGFSWNEDTFASFQSVESFPSLTLL